MNYLIKNVSLKVLAFLGVTVISYTWAVASVYNMVLEHEKQITEVKAQMKDMPADISAIKTTLITQTEDIKFIKNYIMKP